MISKTGLSKDILAMLQSIFKNYPKITKVKIYGSRAKGTYNSRSDIDLVVYGETIDRFLISDILLSFDESDIPYMIDLQSYADIKNRELIEHIDRVGVLVYDVF